MKNKKDLFGFTMSNVDLVEKLNGSILKAKDEISRLNLPDFGSDMCHLNNAGVLLNASDVIDATIAHRLLDKFEKPDVSNERELRKNAVREWIELEDGHVCKYNSYPRASDHQRIAAFRARERCGVILQNFWKYYHQAPLDFGPGESYISNRGRTSVFDKLDVRLWSVTSDCLELFAQIVVSNRGLWLPFLLFSKKEGLTKTLSPKVRTLIKEGSKPRVALVIAVLYHLDLVVQGSRGTSVYKNNKKRRFINIEPFGNVIIQKFIGYALRCCLKDNGLDLDSGQQKHGLQLRQKVSTTDWKSASDVINNAIPKYLLPKSVSEIVQTSRSFVVELKYEVEDKGLIVSHVPHKVSSMGNGFTFELLSLINYVYATMYDDTASAYGDDVTITKNVDEFVEQMSGLGFILNEKKSFINQPFSESCGYFHLEGTGYITCFDFKWNLDILDAIITLNKIRRIYEAHPVSRVALILKKVYEKISPLIPKALYGPKISSVVRGKDLPSWLEVNNLDTVRKSSPILGKAFKEGYIVIGDKTPKPFYTNFEKFVKKTTGSSRSFQKRLDAFKERGAGSVRYSVNELLASWQLSGREVCVVFKVVVEPNVIIPKRAVVKDSRLLYSYIKSGKSENIVVRGKKETRRLKYVPILAFRDGTEIGSLVS